MPTASASTSSCRRETSLVAPRAGEGRARDPAHDGPPAAQASTRPTRREPKAPRFAPAGQSTQMIVGADAADRPDDPAQPAPTLYGAYRLRRVYYSAFSPIPDASRALPLERAAAGARAPALSGRLADALLRLRVERDRRRAATACSTSTIDPKLAWALAPSRPLPGRREQRAARGAAARAGPRHEGGRPDPRVAPAPHASGSTTSRG